MLYLKYMLTIVAKTKSFARRHKVFCTFLIIFVVGYGIWALINLTPRPLGGQMVYLGKEDYGNIFGFDYYPYSVYYYGTDLSRDEAVDYFNKATLRGDRSDHVGIVSIGLSVYGEDVSFDYYSDKLFANFTTDKKYIISVMSEDYRYLRKSLR